MPCGTVLRPCGTGWPCRTACKPLRDTVHAERSAAPCRTECRAFHRWRQKRTSAAASHSKILGATPHAQRTHPAAKEQPSPCVHMSIKGKGIDLVHRSLGYGGPESCCTVHTNARTQRYTSAQAYRYAYASYIVHMQGGIATRCLGDTDHPMPHKTRLLSSLVSPSNGHLPPWPRPWSTPSLSQSSASYLYLALALVPALSRRGQRGHKGHKGHGTSSMDFVRVKEQANNAKDLAQITIVRR